MTSLIKIMIAGFVLATSAAYGKVCELKITGSDAMQFDQKELTIDSSCKKVKLTLSHSGKLPKAAMGHNWVLSKKADMDQLVAASMAAGLAKNYVAEDKRIIAATELVGGGESTSITFDNTLKPGEEYLFYCTFPGHAGIMKGTFVVKS